MGAKSGPAATSPPELAYQLEHPSVEVVWARAVEVFGGEDLAGQWMRTPLPMLGDATPEAHCTSGDAGKQREVLTILGRIDYGLIG